MCKSLNIALSCPKKSQGFMNMVSVKVDATALALAQSGTMDRDNTVGET